jgi:hypothetical protein
MTVQWSQRTAAGVARAVDAWYATTTDGDTAVLALPDTPAIWLVHWPHEHVYWRTEGRRGLTLSLADVRQRLARMQGHGDSQERPWWSCALRRVPGTAEDGGRQQAPVSGP